MNVFSKNNFASVFNCYRDVFDTKGALILAESESSAFSLITMDGPEGL